MTLRFKQPAAGRDATDRVANHRTSSVTDVYDRHGYQDEDRRIMTTIARHVTSIVEATGKTNVIALILIARAKALACISATTLVGISGRRRRAGTSSQKKNFDARPSPNRTS